MKLSLELREKIEETVKVFGAFGNILFSVSVFSIFYAAVLSIALYLMKPEKFDYFDFYFNLDFFSLIYVLSCISILALLYANIVQSNINNKESHLFYNMSSEGKIKYILSGKTDYFLVYSRNSIIQYPIGESPRMQISFLKCLITAKSWTQIDYEEIGLDYAFEYKNYGIATFNDILEGIPLTEKMFATIFEKTYEMKFTEKMKKRFEIVFNTHKNDILPLFRSEALFEKLPPKNIKKKVNKI